MTDALEEARTQKVDLGGLTIQWVMTDPDDDVVTGFVEEHQRPDGEHCEGYVHLRIEGKSPPRRSDGSENPQWNIVSRDPLTLSPSILCLICGHHGFIREGKWVPA